MDCTEDYPLNFIERLPIVGADSHAYTYLIFLGMVLEVNGPGIDFPFWIAKGLCPSPLLRQLEDRHQVLSRTLKVLSEYKWVKAVVLYVSLVVGDHIVRVLQASVLINVQQNDVVCVIVPLRLIDFLKDAV